MKASKSLLKKLNQANEEISLDTEDIEGSHHSFPLRQKVKGNFMSTKP